MASDDPAGALELPQLDQDGVEDARQRASYHVSAAKRVSKGVRIGRRPRVLKDGMEVRDGSGRKEKPPDSSDEEEVGDDWFRLPDANERIGLRIGKIPRRAGMRIRKTIRRVREGRFTSDLVFEDDEDEPKLAALKAHDAKKGDEVDVGGAVLSAVPSTSGATAFYDSPEEGSSDSLVSVDIPLPSRSQISFSRLSQTSSRPGFAPLAQLPTLTELQSRDSAASSSPPESTYSSPLSEAPTRTLTIDDCIDGVSRRDSRLAGRFLRQRHRHFPGRRHLHSQKKRTAKFDTHIGESAELDLSIAKALKEAGVIQEEEDKVECDVLWEHQRGFVRFS